MKDLSVFCHVFTECQRCDRLRTYTRDVAKEKKRAFRQDEYWGRPVPSFGDPDARLWVLGLAPSAHGANRTGRPFTGDQSGVWLYRALFRAGFSNQALSSHKADGLALKGAWVSMVVRCAPPANKPLPDEFRSCRDFLVQERELLKNVQVILALGKVAFDAATQLFQVPRPRPVFRHGTFVTCESSDRRMVIVGSYHPSQQNTFTGVLTEAAFDDVFDLAKNFLNNTS